MKRYQSNQSQSHFLRIMRTKNYITGSLICVVLLVFPVVGISAGNDGTIKFNRDIRPLLSENCFQCHGFDKNTREADLRLDTAAGSTMITGDRDQPAIIPGRSKDSLLVKRIFTEDPDDVMPPPESTKSLSDHERDLLRRWIDQGAEYEEHWAYIKPLKPEIPVADSHSHPIDRFIESGLNGTNMEFSEPATSRELVRRLSFDFLGMPPEVELVERYANVAQDSVAYGKLVDELLASPHFGERMAVYWLDLVRWADTMGFHSDDERFATPYRDYVIESFNQNIPFDQFTREQIAGDLLPGASTNQLIASGYNRMNQVTGEGGAQPKEYRAKYMADKTRNLASVWLGSTLGCAECHDHKFDPFTAKDFYSFAAFFADLEEPDLVSNGRRTGIFHPSIQVDPTVAAQIESIDATIRKLEQNKGSQEEIQKLKKQKESIERKGTWTVISKKREKPRMMRVLPRGNFLDESGEVVEPAIPEFLGSIEKEEGRLDRLDLANWIVDAENPLTARVLVNRLWYLMMGRGLSSVLDDLGYQGDWPSHPELLDWLSVELIESDWNIKHILHLIATSETYRQTSSVAPVKRAADPENRLFARQFRQRVQAEFIRDTALKVSGILNPKIGGRSNRPYQPEGYWDDSYKSVGNPHKYHQDHGDNLYRRGLYTFWKRTFLHPEMLTFDAPNREECVAQRPVSNTPLQALVLLNDPTFVESARVLAQKTLTSPDLGDGFLPRLNFIWQSVLQRHPIETEVETLKRLHAATSAHYTGNPQQAAALIQVGEYPHSDEVDPVQLASWISITRAALNLHETITRP